MRKLLIVTLIILAIVSSIIGCTPTPAPAPTPAPEPLPDIPPTSVPESAPIPVPSTSQKVTEVDAAPAPDKTEPAPSINWQEVSAPAGVEFAGAHWIEINAPQGRKILAVYFLPKGEGPFPVVAILHGTEGFRERQVELAQDFSGNGFIGVAGAWFGGHYQGVGTPTPVQHNDGIVWPNGPDIKSGNDPAAVRDVMALVDAARRLPSARADSVGIFGHSRGSAVALKTASTGEDLQAVVAVAGYPPGTTYDSLKSPVLIVHGTLDKVVPLEKAQSFEKSLLGLGKVVEAQYLDGAPHTSPWTSPWSDSVLGYATEFFRKYLRPR